MTKPRKLSHGEIRFLHLIVKDKNADGWTLVSKIALPLVRTLPTELVEIHETASLNFVKLTLKGQQVYDAMPYFKLA